MSMQDWRYDRASRQWRKSRKLPRHAKAWLCTVKGRDKHALKTLLLNSL